MSSPQGGATQQVAPVQVSPVPEFNINQVIATGANLFGEYLNNKAKATAAATEDSVISEYSQSEDRIAQAVKTGAMKASDARAASQSNYSRYVASHPGLIDKFSKVWKMRQEGTATGDVYDEVKAEKAANDRLDLYLENNGTPNLPWYSPETKEKNRDQGRYLLRVEAESKRRVSQKSEKYADAAAYRSASDFERAQMDREEKENASKLLNETVAKRFDVMSGFSKDALKYIDSAPDKVQAYNQVMAEWGKQMAEIRATGAAIGGANNQALVAPYLKVFEDMNTLTQQMLKPGADVEALKSQWEGMQLKAKIAIGSKPGVMTKIMGSELLGPMATTMGQIADDAVYAAVADIGDKSYVDAPYGATPVVGNPTVEAGVLDGLHSSLIKLQSDKDVFGDKAAATEECKRSVNLCLRQTENIVKQGATPQALTKIMGFYAKLEFGKAAEGGMIDNRALNGVTEAYDVYGRAVVNSVTEELKRYVGPVGRSKGIPTQMSEMVDLNFSGGKVNFVPIDKSEKSAESVKAMRKSEEAITHLVFVGAHINKTTDYAKYWETNKHKILPNMYFDSAKYPVGVMVESKGKILEYIGGPHTSDRSWREVKKNAATKD